jgi:hypothetical protein
VKTNCHHPIRGIECLLDAVAMVHVNVDIQDTIVIPDVVGKSWPPLRCEQPLPQQFEDSQHDVCRVGNEKILHALAQVPHHSRSRIHWLRSSSHGVNHQPN